MNGNGVGRPQADIDMQVALDLIERGGASVKETAQELGCSVPTLRKRIADLQLKQGVLLQYRAIQSLQLTELQARVLEAITPAKINEASLRDLVACYKILKDKELNIEGKPSEIKGLVAHLIHIERQEAALKNGTTQPEEESVDAEYVFVDEVSPNSLENLDEQDF